MYTYASPAGICWGKTTYKYELQNNILVEVQQQFYSINTYSVISKDIDLLKAPQSDSQKVASLQAGMGTNIIGVSYDKNNDSLWFLVKTPLGLIGWANSLKDDVIVFNITQCN